MIGSDNFSYDYYPPGHPKHMLCERYELSCDVRVQRISRPDKRCDGTTRGNVEENMVILLPKEGSQKNLFYGAWLPEGERSQDIGVIFHHPIYGKGFVGLKRPSKIYPHSPYMWIMSLKREDEFLNQLKGDDSLWKNVQAGKANLTISLTVLGQHEFHLCQNIEPFSVTLTK